MKSKALIGLLCTITLLATPHATLAQEQDSPKPDRWRNLVIDESTPEDAIKLLGKPKKDSPSQLSANPIDGWLTKKRKEKIFRTLEYSKPEGIDKAWLTFYDGKLVSIMLDVKKGIDPNGLNNIYGINFEPVFSQSSIAFSPRDFERNQGKVYAKTYPTVYSMVGLTEKTFVTVMVSNVPSFGGALARSMGVPDSSITLPGKVEFIQLTSRTLENKDGANVLR